MELVTGQEVWIAFASGGTAGGGPIATVRRGVVLDGENRVVKRDGGHVSVLQTWSVEQCHETEAAAWTANADLLERFVAPVVEKSQECRQAAAEAAAKAAVVTAGGASV